MLEVPAREGRRKPQALPPDGECEHGTSPCGSASVRSPWPVDGVSISCLPFRGSTSGASSCTCLPSPGNILTSRSAMLLRPGHQRLGLGGGGFFSPASRSDAGGSLGHWHQHVKVSPKA